MEGEPVARHLGNFKKIHKKESFCLFIAPKISEGTLSHFYALHNMNISYYGGQSHIIPMDVQTFMSMVAHAKSKKGVKSEQIKKYFKFLIEKTTQSSDEKDWLETIVSTAPKWTEYS